MRKLSRFGVAKGAERKEMTKDKLPYSARRWVKRHAFPILSNVNGTLLNTLEMMYSSGTLPEDIKSCAEQPFPTPSIQIR
jgi:hypothetical protein